MKEIKHLHLWIILCLCGVLISPTQTLAQSLSSEAKEINVETQKKASKKEMEVEIKKQKEKTKNNAGIEWKLHQSITDIFSAKFPKTYKYKTFPLQITEDTFAVTSEIFSSLDGIDSKTREKSVLIKAVHTFGDELTYKETQKILNVVANRYVQSAASVNGRVVKNQDFEHQGFLGKDIYISYNIKDEKYGLRIRVFMTNFAKVEQVLSGPANTMYSYRSDDFFKSITLYDGRVQRRDVPMGYGWIEHPSENNIFTAVLPPKNKDYTPLEPVFTSTPKTGYMHYKLIDPVRDKSVTYNVYSYKTGTRMNYETVKEIVFSNHVSKFVENADKNSLNMKNKKVDGVRTMSTKLVISVQENMPDINTIFLEARYSGDAVLVQEFLCGPKFAKSNIHDTLFSQVKFHPEKYSPLINKRVKKSNGDKSAPKEKKKEKK